MSIDMNGTPPAQDHKPATQQASWVTAANFIGTEKLKVGPTGVVTFPKVHQRALLQSNEGNLVMVPRNKNKTAYWQIYTLKGFKQLYLDADTNPKFTTKEEKNLFKKILAATAINIDLDSQGRFTLDKRFIDEKLAENREIVLEGAFDHIKVWAKTDHENELARIAALEEAAASDVMSKGLDD